MQDSNVSKHYLPVYSKTNIIIFSNTKSMKKSIMMYALPGLVLITKLERDNLFRVVAI